MCKYIDILKKNIEKLLKDKEKINIILVRHGESISNQSGTLSGWTDSPLTIKGRQQAHNLLPSFFPLKQQFQKIYSSDLSRVYDTAQIALGFPTQRNFINKNRSLRELNFGEDENRHFDSLSNQEKEIVNSIEYKAPKGESWYDVRNRVQSSFYENLKENGTYLAFTHGGLICSITWDLGLQEVISNCSVIGLQLIKHPDMNQLKPSSILFQWNYDENLLLGNSKQEQGVTEL